MSMTRFELPAKTRLHIINVHPRREKHGDENKTAVDVKVRWETTNTALAMLDPQLMGALYFKGAGAAAAPQATIEGVEAISDMPNLRFPRMLPFSWELDLSGYTFRVDYGTGGKSDLVLGGCDVNKFKVFPKEGGTSIIELRIQCSGPEERVLGKLSMLIDQKIEATLVGPEETQQAGIGGDPAADGDAAAAARKFADQAWPFPGKGKAPTEAPPQSAVVRQEGKPGEVPPMPKRAAAAKKVEEKAAPVKRAPAGVKYRNAETGDTWSGRGLQPNWLKTALANGRKLDEFVAAS